MMQQLDPKDVVAIHASSVFNEDGALLFLGPSGTGKSTVCNLFSAHMDVLAEDAVYLAPHIGSNWKVFCGDKFAHIETIRFFLNKAPELSYAPLRAIFRLNRAEEPKLEKIDALLTCRYLTDAYFEVVQQRANDLDVKRRAFVMLAKIARFLDGYAFHFNLSSQTPEVLNREMKLW